MQFRYDHSGGTMLVMSHSHRCGYPLGFGADTCKNRVADPEQMRCHLHTNKLRRSSMYVPETECRLLRRSLYDWECATHQTDSQWAVARALGAGLPCQLPIDPTVAVYSDETSASTLEILYHMVSTDIGSLSEIAQHKNTPAPIREQLSRHPLPDVRWKVAESTAPISTSIMLRLATDPDVDVRIALSERQDLPLGVLEHLIRDHEPAVRLNLAERESTPIPLLERLLRDDEEQVREAAKVSLAAALGRAAVH